MKVKVMTKKSRQTLQGSMSKKKKWSTFWRNVWAIIRGKASEEGSFSTGVFTVVLSWFFNLLAIFGVLLFVGTIYSAVISITEMTWEINAIFDNLAVIIMIFSISFCVLIFSLVFRGAANDMKQEKDRNYIIALFSGIVSFAAMVIAFVSLVKG